MRMWRRALLVAAATVAAVIASQANTQLAAAPQDDPLRHGHALVIGVWNYDDKAWPSVNDIALETQKIADGLAKHFDTVDVISKPTYDELNSGLRDFLRKYGNDTAARLLIYYSGHGYTQLDFLRNQNRGFITSIDTPTEEGTPRRNSSISMDEIRSMVSDVDARQILFIFDSCFAGTIFGGRSLEERGSPLKSEDIARLLNEPVRQFITAGDDNETVPPDTQFAAALLNALDGAADSDGTGVITGHQLGWHLWRKMRQSGLSNNPREGKLPFGSFARGEFLFRSTAGIPLDTSTVPDPPQVPPPVERSLTPMGQPASSKTVTAVDGPPGVPQLRNPSIAKVFAVKEKYHFVLMETTAGATVSIGSTVYIKARSGIILPVLIEKIAPSHLQFSGTFLEGRGTPSIDDEVYIAD